VALGSGANEAPVLRIDKMATATSTVMSVSSVENRGEMRMPSLLEQLVSTM